jgi:hypothetical protein
MPAHLSKAQRNLIFRPTRKKELEAEPIIANIAEEEFPLEHINTEERPSIVTTFNNALALMQPKDCNNIPNLLQGLHNAKINWGYTKIRPVLAVLVKHGREDVIMECLRRVKDTRMQMDTLWKTTAVMHGLIERTMKNGWGEAQTKKALERVERVAIMLEDPAHAGELPSTNEWDPRNKSEAIGILLEIAAVRVSKHTDGKDEDGKVADYANRLVNAAPFIPARNSDGWMRNELYILHGMKVALTLLDSKSELSARLKARYEELGQMIEDERQAHKFQGRTYEIQEMLFGAESS